MAEGDAGTVAYDDAFLYEVVVDFLGVNDLHKYEIGIRGIYLLADWQELECLYHSLTLLIEQLYPVLYGIGVVETLYGLLLREPLRAFHP